MRISDWSSDVCSSDLGKGGHGRTASKRFNHHQPERVGTARKHEHIGRRISGGQFVPVQRPDKRHFRKFALQTGECGTISHHHLASGMGGLEERLDILLHRDTRSEEHTSELQSLMRSSYAVFCLKKTKITNTE